MVLLQRYLSSESPRFKYNSSMLQYQGSRRFSCNVISLVRVPNLFAPISGESQYYSFVFHYQGNGGGPHVQCVEVQDFQYNSSMLHLGESQWSSCSVNSLKTAVAKGDLSCLNDNNAKQVNLFHSHWTTSTSSIRVAKRLLRVIIIPFFIFHRTIVSCIAPSQNQLQYLLNLMFLKFINQ
jgi:hypothetical protein